MIGATAMHMLLKEGTPAYFLHVSALKDTNQTSENLKATKMKPSDGEEVLKKAEESEEGVPKEIADMEKEELRKREREELEKHVPIQYRDYMDVFSPGEAQELPPHRPYDI